LRYALTLKGRNTVYNPYPARSTHPSQRTLGRGRKAQKAGGTSLSRSRKTFFPMRKKNRCWEKLLKLTA
jgi:hypothetical protein